jgi:hypothetical protein
MKIKMTVAGVLTSFLLLASPVVMADGGMTVFGGPKLGYRTINYHFDESGGTFNSRYLMLDLAVGGAAEKLYWKLNYDISVKDALEYARGTGGGSKMTFAKRDEYGLTVGYRVSDSLNVFAGYLNGRTDAATINDTNPPNVNAKNTSNVLEDAGPYVGVSYRLWHSDTGSLSANVAYADMAGSITFRDDAVLYASTGRTAGFRYGLAWSGTLQGTLAYELGLQATTYRYTQTAMVGSSENYTSTQTQTALLFGVYKYF